MSLSFELIIRDGDAPLAECEMSFADAVEMLRKLGQLNKDSGRKVKVTVPANLKNASIAALSGIQNRINARTK